MSRPPIKLPELIRRTPPKPEPPQPEPSNQVTVDLFRGLGLSRLLGRIGIATVDLEKLLGIDRMSAEVMNRTLSDLSRAKDTDAQLRELQKGLDDAEVDDLLSNPRIKETPSLVDHILENSPRDSVEYIRQHIEEKLNSALADLRTEAQRATANKRARARGLPATDAKDFAAALLKGEARAIKRRLNDFPGARTNTGRPHDWTDEAMRSAVNRTIQSMKTKGTFGSQKRIGLFVKEFKRLHRNDPDVRENIRGKDDDAIRRAIARYLGADWTLLKSNWQEAHLKQNGNNSTP